MGFIRSDLSVHTWAVSSMYKGMYSGPSVYSLYILKCVQKSKYVHKYVQLQPNGAMGLSAFVHTVHTLN